MPAAENVEEEVNNHGPFMTAGVNRLSLDILVDKKKKREPERPSPKEWTMYVFV